MSAFGGEANVHRSAGVWDLHSFRLRSAEPHRSAPARAASAIQTIQRHCHRTPEELPSAYLALLRRKTRHIAHSRLFISPGRSMTFGLTGDSSPPRPLVCGDAHHGCVADRIGFGSPLADTDIHGQLVHQTRRLKSPTFTAGQLRGRAGLWETSQRQPSPATSGRLLRRIGG